MTFTVKNFGCKVNQYETQAMKEILRSIGLEFVRDLESSDVVLVNSCTVTDASAQKSKRFVNSVLKRNDNAIVLLTGCYAEENHMKYDNNERVVIVRNFSKNRIGDILTEYLSDNMGCFQEHGSSYVESGYTPLNITEFSDRSRAFIKIQDGCNKFCSYCKIPYVRGLSKSRPLQDIILEAERIVSMGISEIVLTGICMGFYGKDIGGGAGLLDVIEKIVQIEGLGRLRLSSIEPEHFPDRVITLMGKTSKICPHVHIPLQSGSNKILKLMNRSYSSENYIELADMLKAAVEDVAISTDVMVGFFYETSKEFNETVSVLNVVRPMRLHIFPYSPRKGTKALEFKKGRVKAPEVKARAVYLKELSSVYKQEFIAGYLNKTLNVLVEGKKGPMLDLFGGYSENYIKVYIKNIRISDIGKIKRVRIDEIFQDFAVGFVED